MKDEETTILYLRGFPKDVARKIRAVSILSGKKITQYVADVLTAHLEALEQREGQAEGGESKGVYYNILSKLISEHAQKKPKPPKGKAPGRKGS